MALPVHLEFGSLCEGFYEEREKERNGVKQVVEANNASLGSPKLSLAPCSSRSSPCPRCIVFPGLIRTDKEIPLLCSQISSPFFPHS